MSTPFLLLQRIEVLPDGSSRHFPPTEWREALHYFAETTRTATFPGIFFRGQGDQDGDKVIGLHFSESDRCFEGHGPSTLNDDRDSRAGCLAVRRDKFAVAEGIDRFLLDEKVCALDIGGVVLKKTEVGLVVGAHDVARSLTDLFWI